MIFLVFLSGCTFNSKLEKYEVSKSNDEVKYNDVIFRLVSEKEEYKHGEEVKLFGEIEYVGEKEEVEIPLSAIIFSIKEIVRDYDIKYRRMDKNEEQAVLISTTLKQGEPYRFMYDRKASYSPKDDNDSYVRFIQSFVDFGFPKGYYVVNGHIELLSGTEEKDENREKVKLESKIEFKVFE